MIPRIEIIFEKMNKLDHIKSRQKNIIQETKSYMIKNTICKQKRKGNKYIWSIHVEGSFIFKLYWSLSSQYKKDEHFNKKMGRGIKMKNLY